MFSIHTTIALHARASILVNPNLNSILPYRTQTTNMIITNTSESYKPVPCIHYPYDDDIYIERRENEVEEYQT